MKSWLSQFFLVLIIVAVAYWLLEGRGEIQPPQILLARLREIQVFYNAHQILTIVLFSVAHIFAATFSVPGGCTLLNVTSGAVFGLWIGCAVVYPVTMVSGCMGYFSAKWFRDRAFVKKYHPQIDSLSKHLKKREYFYFVLLRLSPFVSYSIVNVMLGLIAVPFSTFFLTTLVGIFFDVVLLNSLGASVAAAAAVDAGQRSRGLLIAFVALLVLALVAQRIWQSRTSERTWRVG